MTANDLVFSPHGSEETEFSRQSLEVDLPGPFCRATTLIVSDIVVVAFIDAYLGGRSPYGWLPETAPSFVEATPRSEAQPAEAVTGPSPRVGAFHRAPPPASP